MKVLTRTLLGRVPFHSASRRTLRPHYVAAATAAASFTRVAPGGLANISTQRRILASGPYGTPKLQRLSPVAFTRGFSTDKTPIREEPPSFAFAFDIDGVLLHVAKPIPGARETLQYLQEHSIPFILLTNGGGKHEAERVADLSARLGVQLSTDNFVQSHTPFQELVSGDGEEEGGGGGLRDKTILVTGSDADKARDIAEAYGFGSVVTPADILAAHPTIWPFEPLMKEKYAASARPLPTTTTTAAATDITPTTKIDAIFVFNDPRDWALDIQIIVDLLLSEGGVLGTYSAKNGDGRLPGAGWQQDGQPPLFFSNPDLFWSAQYHFPRLGQGAFQAALAGVWREVTGGAAALRRTVIGKPHRQTYAYAERVLGAHRAELLLGKKHGGGGVGTAPKGEKTSPPSTERVAGGSRDEEHVGPLRSVYMVGDNPESDIRGANEYRSAEGTEWTSVLVRTGVWDPKRVGEPRHKPKMIVDDVKAAVDWALRQEGWR